MGSIQISCRKPIILLSDRQTTGGYTSIANVITADFRILGQLESRDRLQFKDVTIDEAQTALLMRRGNLNGLKKANGRE